jgi:hypothetical protein
LKAALFTGLEASMEKLEDGQWRKQTLHCGPFPAFA